VLILLKRVRVFATSYSTKNQVPLTFDLGPDHIHLVAVGGSGPQESNPVAVTHAASVHLRYLIVTAEPMSDLQNEEHPVALLFHISAYILLKLLAYSFHHKRIFEYLSPIYVPLILYVFPIWLLAECERR
jgi:hypothetical protein